MAKKGHSKLECFKRKQNKTSEDAKKTNKEDKAMIAAVKQDKWPARTALTASYKAFIDSGATTHMMKDVWELPENPFQRTSISERLVKIQSRRGLRVSLL